MTATTRRTQLHEHRTVVMNTRICLTVVFIHPRMHVQRYVRQKTRYSNSVEQHGIRWRGVPACVRERVYVYGRMLRFITAYKYFKYIKTTTKYHERHHVENCVNFRKNLRSYQVNSRILEYLPTDKTCRTLSRQNVEDSFQKYHQAEVRQIKVIDKSF